MPSSPTPGLARHLELLALTDSFTPILQEGADQNPKEVLDVLISEVKRILLQRDTLMVEQRKMVLQRNQVEELQRVIDREREDIQMEREKLFEEQRQLSMIKEGGSS